MAFIAARGFVQAGRVTAFGGRGAWLSARAAVGARTGGWRAACVGSLGGSSVEKASCAAVAPPASAAYIGVIRTPGSEAAGGTRAVTALRGFLSGPRSRTATSPGPEGEVRGLLRAPRTPIAGWLVRRVKVARPISRGATAQGGRIAAALVSSGPRTVGPRPFLGAARKRVAGRRGGSPPGRLIRGRIPKSRVTTAWACSKGPAGAGRNSLRVIGSTMR